ncbi:hypothetical protein PVAP13_8KG123702 [Panicum virgatum]|uniref:Uncharacterized protein n=1 Tax=Panicum virgatum TaxID=38727 RepID=A0A8T0PJM9_PANVG|nr:hypothetical protein PVAP13_8KG123702 [Panicum virgatum]
MPSRLPRPMNATVLAMVEAFLAFTCSIHIHINSTPISHSIIPSPSLYPEGPKISPLLVNQIHVVRVEGGDSFLIKAKSSHKLISLLDVAATLAFLTNSALGLLGDDQEWSLALNDAAQWASPYQQAKIMTSTKKLQDITLGQQDCKILGRLTRLWDSKNMRSKSADPLISIDGIIIDEKGTMVQITVPKKLAQQFRPLLAEGQGSVYIFTNLTAVDSKQRTYIYHHQKYMLQFQPNSKVHRLDSRGDKIPHYAFKFAHLISYHQKTLHQSHF